MNISIQTLLAKMNEELQLAESSTEQESLREKVYSIKILCELILDEKPKMPVNQPAPVITQPVYQQPVVTQRVFQQPASLPQAKKIEMEDEANGDSLFDF